MGNALSPDRSAVASSCKYIQPHVALIAITTVNCDPECSWGPMPGLCQQLSLIGHHGGDVLSAASWAEGWTPVHSPRAGVILVMGLHAERLVHLGYLKYRELNHGRVRPNIGAAFFFFFFFNPGPSGSAAPGRRSLSPWGGTGGLCWAMEVPEQVVAHCLCSGPWPVSLFPASVWVRLTSSQLGTYPLHR